MERKHLEQHIIKIIKSELEESNRKSGHDLYSTDVRLESSLQKDLGCDSLKCIDLWMEVELEYLERLNRDGFPKGSDGYSVLMGIHTVKDLVDTFEKYRLK